MKKTLIALMALASVASASLTLDSTLTGNSASYTWTADQSSAAVTLILSESSMDKLYSGYDSDFNEGFASFILNSGKAGETDINQITLEHKYDNAPKGFRVTNTEVGTAWGNDIKESVFGASVYGGNAAWNTAKSAALTFALDAQGNTYTILSVIDVNGVITNIGTATTATDVTFTGIDRIQANKNNRVDTTYVYSGSWTAADLTKVTNDALWKQIPEPTTATLSLLALAGLAARRRRK